MTLFGRGTAAGLDSRSSPVLSPTRWSLNAQRPTQYTLSDGLGTNEHSYLSSRRKYGSDARYQTDTLNNRLDSLSKPSDPFHGSTPEMRALRSRIMDSPGHSSALDVPLYLRSVDTRRITHTPKRITTLDSGAASPRRNNGYLSDDMGFKFNSPLLSGDSRFRRRSRGSVPELRIGAYTPQPHDRFGGSTSYRAGRNFESSKRYKTSPVKNRINIHATDDILNRIKRGLSECENISKRLDKQYGSTQSQLATLDYGERVFPRALADNLFSNRNNTAPIYRNKLNISRANIVPTAEEDTSAQRDVEKGEQPKNTLTRILENIKRIRDRSIFSDNYDSIGKRKFVEVEEEVEPPPITTQRTRSLDVDAIQQRIKQQRRNLLSQRNLRHFD